MVNSSIQEQDVKIVEDFFLSRTDKDLYTFIQEALGKPLAEKVIEKNKDNQPETARILGLLYSEV